QSPETAMEVVSCPAPGGDSRFAPPPRSLVTNASTFPLVSPGTRFVAAERNATHEAGWWNEPSIAGENDGPSAGRPLNVREIRIARPGRQAAPSLRTGPARRTANTSVVPSASFGTRLEASDWKAMARAKRLSWEITPCVEAPFGMPPPIASES